MSKELEVWLSIYLTWPSYQAEGNIYDTTIVKPTWRLNAKDGPLLHSQITYMSPRSIKVRMREGEAYIILKAFLKDILYLNQFRSNFLPPVFIEQLW